MKKVYLIHGFNGLPNGGWLPYVMKELGKDFIFTCSLPMPNTSEPKKEEWVQKIQEEINDPNEEIFLVGHSLGVPAIFHYLNSLKENQKIGGAVLVSGLFESIQLDNDKFRKIDNFTEKPLDFSLIKNKAKRFIVIHGIKDNIVPFNHAEKISQDLDCELVKVENGDHFTQVAEPRTFELPIVVEKLKELMS